ncbi:hypothetical protein JQK19_20740 [Chromobacterium violaceum]|uniref:hypothetical protein n=1 Tax=Chromobacterium violaceum TaxID=536 RepID=UPI001BEA844B|nr:hypothetical protein [Chromobacterium violaceum]MBT2869661.1 hypothetical protein [Chromobacterium violaceum]
MLTPSCAAPPRRPDSREPRDHKPSEDDARFFRALLETEADADIPPPLSGWIALTPPPPPSPRDSSVPRAAAAAASIHAAPASPPPAAIDQTLLLHASNGPLAGMSLLARWRGDRLSLKLTPPDAASAARLARHAGALRDSLGQALGVAVELEIEDAG